MAAPLGFVPQLADPDTGYGYGGANIGSQAADIWQYLKDWRKQQLARTDAFDLLPMQGSKAQGLTATRPFEDDLRTLFTTDPTLPSQQYAEQVAPSAFNLAGLAMTGDYGIGQLGGRISNAAPLERPVKAAFRFGDDVFTGTNHGIAMSAAEDKIGSSVWDRWNKQTGFGGDEGFVTDRGRFVGRQEADQLAKDAGLKDSVLKDILPNSGPNAGLHSHGLGDLLRRAQQRTEETGFPDRNSLGIFGGKLPKGISTERNFNPTTGQSNYTIKKAGWFGDRNIGDAYVRDLGDNAQVGRINIQEPYRNQGIATALYGQIENDLGKSLIPDGYLTDASYGFWKKYRPEAVADYKKQDNHWAPPDWRGQFITNKNDAPIANENSAQLKEQLAALESLISAPKAMQKRPNEPRSKHSEE